MLIRNLLASAGALVAALPLGAVAQNQVNMSPGVTAVGAEIYDLHMLIMIICIVIGILVFGAMFYQFCDTGANSRALNRANAARSSTSCARCALRCFNTSLMGGVEAPDARRRFGWRSRRTESDGTGVARRARFEPGFSSRVWLRVTERVRGIKRRNASG